MSSEKKGSSNLFPHGNGFPDQSRYYILAYVDWEDCYAGAVLEDRLLAQTLLEALIADTKTYWHYLARFLRKYLYSYHDPWTAEAAAVDEAKAVAFARFKDTPLWETIQRVFIHGNGRWVLMTWEEGLFQVPMDLPSTEDICP